MQVSKNFFVSILLFIGTIVIFIGANLISPEYIIAQDESVCFMTQPSGQVVDLSEICRRREETAGERQDLKAEMETQRFSAEALDQMQRGQFQQALDNLTQVISINPSMPEAYYERGTMHIATNNPQAAIADFQRAIDLYRAKGGSESVDSLQQLIKETQENLS
jgi:tetratricopeptide (TPR) repeat protein